MVGLLKAFGKGILYVLGFPFFLVALILFAVFGLGAFIFQLIRSIIFFFTGQKFFPELPEDKALRLKLHPEQAVQEEEIKEEKQEDGDSVLETITTSEQVNQEVYKEPEPAPQPVAPQTVEDAVFMETTTIENENPEPVKEETEDPFASLLDNQEEIKQEAQTITRFCPYCGSKNVIPTGQKQYECFSCRHVVDVIQPIFEPKPEIDIKPEPMIDTTMETQTPPQPKQEEILEVYTPRTNTFNNQFQGEEDNDDTGVTIDFDN